MRKYCDFCMRPIREAGRLRRVGVRSGFKGFMICKRCREKYEGVGL